MIDSTIDMFSLALVFFYRSYVEASYVPGSSPYHTSLEIAITPKVHYNVLASNLRCISEHLLGCIALILHS